MVAFDARNAHAEYMDVVRHWSPESEAYAGGDALVTFLNQDWRLGETVLVEEYWHAGTRLVLIYHIDLVRENDVLRMPVLTNPYVRRLIESLPVQMRGLNEEAEALAVKSS